MAVEPNRKLVSLRPGWIKKVDDKINQDGFRNILLFYLLETPCEGISYQSSSLARHGWKKNMWSNKSGGLRDKLMTAADLEFGQTLFKVERLNDMSRILSNARMNDNFQKNRLRNKAVVYLSGQYRSTFMSIFYHIRNSIAHGRFSIYDDSGKILYVFESGIKKNDKFEVRARIVLSEKTLLEWIKIIEDGPNL